MLALYDWAFSCDGCVVKEPEKDIHLLIMPGDKVEVFSDRHQCWFNDGIVTATFRDGIRVQYGMERYFGFALSKGNSKYLKTSEVHNKIRLLTSDNRYVRQRDVTGASMS